MITKPTPQRMLRGHLPQRVNTRAAGSAEHYAFLTERLQPRDRWLARMLHEHKVFTSHQITQLAWPSIRAANLRLLQLYRWRIVDRFQPFITFGSAPMHYVLDVAGATTLAHEDGLSPKDLNYRHDREIGRALSLQLAHTIGTNGIFTTLIARARQPHATGTVTAWWSETRCAHHFGDIVRPDAYGRWQEHGREVEWFLEFDFGTEPLPRLAAKLTAYERLATNTGITTPILIWLPTTRREASARAALTTALGSLDRPELVPVATTATDLAPTADALDPTIARWAVLKPQHESGRQPLIALTQTVALRPPTPAGQAASTSLPTGLAPPSPMPPNQPTYPLRR